MARVDAVMLSDETAVGLYPVRTVEIMANTVQQGESEIFDYHDDFDLQFDDEIESIKKGIARYTLMMADDLAAKAVVIFSYTGRLASYLSAFKPNQPVYSFTMDENTHYALGINYWIFSEKVEWLTWEMSHDQKIAIQILKDKWVVTIDDFIVVIWTRDAEDQRQPQMRVVRVK